MRQSADWTHRVLAVLRHDLTLVALAVAFVVLSAGVFAVASREDLVAQDESPAVSDAASDAEPVLADTWRADASFESADAVFGDGPILESTEAQAGQPMFVPELATDTLVPANAAWKGSLDFEHWLACSEFAAGYDQLHKLH